MVRGVMRPPPAVEREREERGELPMSVGPRRAPRRGESIEDRAREAETAWVGEG